MRLKLGIAVAVLVGLPVAFAEHLKNLPVGDVLNWIVVRLRHLLGFILSLVGF
jgi:hypothetical protein